MKERRPARYIGVDTYQDPGGRFLFRYPIDWTRSELTGNREGVAFMPEDDDPLTAFSAWISPLELPVVAEDYGDLRQGVQEGLAQLAELNVEHEADDLLGNLVKFERIFTFREDGVTRKRKQWIMYVDKWLLVVTWQGSDLEAYDYWFAMANYAFNTFNINEYLWFATDRDLAGLHRTTQAATSAETSA